MRFSTYEGLVVSDEYYQATSHNGTVMDCEKSPVKGGDRGELTDDVKDQFMTDF